MDMNLNENILRTARFADQLAMASAAATRILHSFYVECRVLPEAEYKWYAESLEMAATPD
ncbi:MAG TPA: hypothetical protein VFH67_03475 [bacterium]|nr:hypothetical protein [bacterium]